MRKWGLEKQLWQINFHLPRPRTSYFYFLTVKEHTPPGIILPDSGRLHAGLDWVSVKGNLLQFRGWFLKETVVLHFLYSSWKICQVWFSTTAPLINFPLLFLHSWLSASSAFACNGCWQTCPHGLAFCFPAAKLKPYSPWRGALAPGATEPGVLPLHISCQVLAGGSPNSSEGTGTHPPAPNLFPR